MSIVTQDRSAHHRSDVNLRTMVLDGCGSQKTSGKYQLGARITSCTLVDRIYGQPLLNLASGPVIAERSLTLDYSKYVQNLSLLVTYVTITQGCGLACLWRSF